MSWQNPLRLIEICHQALHSRQKRFQIACIFDNHTSHIITAYALKLDCNSFVEGAYSSSAWQWQWKYVYCQSCTKSKPNNQQCKYMIHHIEYRQMVKHSRVGHNLDKGDGSSSLLISLCLNTISLLPLCVYLSAASKKYYRSCRSLTNSKVDFHFHHVSNGHPQSVAGWSQ